MKPSPEDIYLGGFFVDSISTRDGMLIIKIAKSESLGFSKIDFERYEAFQVFNESDYHDSLANYKTVDVYKTNAADSGVFQVLESGYFDTFKREEGRASQESPLCFLISTPQEQIEVITFYNPRLT